MLMNIKLSDKQCGKIAESIFKGNFRVYGLGHFDVDVKEFAEIIKIVFNEKDPDAKLREYYKKLSL